LIAKGGENKHLEGSPPPKKGKQQITCRSQQNTAAQNPSKTGCVTQANEGELLLVKRVLFGFQSITEKPKEDPLHTQEEKAIISTPLAPSKLNQKSSPKKTSPIETFHFQSTFFKSSKNF